MIALNRRQWGARLQASWILFAAIATIVERYTASLPSDAKLPISTITIICGGFLIVLVVGHTVFNRDTNICRQTLIITLAVLTYLLLYSEKFNDYTGMVILVIVISIIYVMIWSIKDDHFARVNTLLGSVFVTILLSTLCSFLGFVTHRLLVTVATQPGYVVVGRASLGAFAGLLIGLLVRHYLVDSLNEHRSQPKKSTIICLSVLFFLIYGVVGATLIKVAWVNSTLEGLANGFVIGGSYSISTSISFAIILLTLHAYSASYSKFLRRSVIILPLHGSIAGILQGIVVWYIRQHYETQANLLLHIAIEIISFLMLSVSILITIAMVNKIVEANLFYMRKIGPPA